MSHPPLTSPLIPRRPLSVGDVLSTTFALYKRGLLTIALLALAPSIISVVSLMIGLVLLIGPLILILLNYGLYYAWDGFFLARLGTIMAGLAVMLVGMVLTWVSQLWASATVASAISKLDCGEQPTLKSLWSESRGLIGHCFALTAMMIGASFAAMAVLLSLIGMIATENWYGYLLYWSGGALIVVALYLQGRLALTTAVLGIEKLGPIEALKRSWRLTELHVWRVVGISMLVTVLISVGNQLLSTIGNATLSPMLDQFSNYYPGQDFSPLLLAALPILFIFTAISILYSVLATPLAWIVNAVLYFDLLRRPVAPAPRAQFRGPVRQQPDPRPY